MFRYLERFFQVLSWWTSREFSLSKLFLLDNIEWFLDQVYIGYFLVQRSKLSTNFLIQPPPPTRFVLISLPHKRNPMQNTFQADISAMVPKKAVVQLPVDAGSRLYLNSFLVTKFSGACDHWSNLSVSNGFPTILSYMIDVMVHRQRSLS